MASVDAKDVLKAAIEIERKVARIYRIFHNKFAGDERYENLWKTLAEDEDAHAAFLRNKLSMMENVPAAFGGSAVGIEDLNAASAALDGHIEYAEKGGYDALEALTLAAKIEHTLVELEYAKLVKVVSPALSKIFEELTKDDHKYKLTEALRAEGTECK